MIEEDFFYENKLEQVERSCKTFSSEVSPADTIDGGLVLDGTGCGGGMVNILDGTWLSRWMGIYYLAQF